MNNLLNILAWTLLINGMVSTIGKLIAKHEGDENKLRHYETQFMLSFIAWLLVKVLQELL